MAGSGICYQLPPRFRAGTYCAVDTHSASGLVACGDLQDRSWERSRIEPAIMWLVKTKAGLRG
jgi:hypothetical protein